MRMSSRAFGEDSWAEIVETARWLAEPDKPAVILDPDNRSRKRRYDFNVAEGESFAVTPRLDLLALDIDGVQAWEWRNDVIDDIETRGGRWALLGSGRPGHELLWLTVAAGWTQGEYREYLESLTSRPALDGESNVRRAATKPPLAPNVKPDAGPVFLIDPPDLNGWVRRLAIPRLSDAARRLQREGMDLGVDLRNGKPSRRTATTRLATHYVNCRLPNDAFIEACLDPGNGISEKWLDLARHTAERELAQIFDDQFAWVRENPPLSDERKALRGFRLEASAADWKGQQHAYNLLVRLIWLAYEANTLMIGQSHRSLASWLGIGRKAVRAALRALLADGRIRKPDRGFRETSTYELLVDAKRRPQVVPLSTGAHGLLHGSFVSRLRRHDAFTRGGLPQGAADTLGALSGTTPKTTKRVHEDRIPRGVTRRTIQGHLDKLQSAGLADHRDGGWVIVPFTVHTLDKLAQRYDTAGKQELRAAQHRLERDMFNGGYRAIAEPDRDTT